MIEMKVGDRYFVIRLTGKARSLQQGKNRNPAMQRWGERISIGAKGAIIANTLR